MDASMAPQDDLAPEIVRAVRAGKPLTADQLVATGQDIEVFADAWQLFMPHLSQMRGFKPCISYYGSRYRNLPSLTIDDKSVDEVHLLRIYTFTVREKWVAEGEYTLKRHLDVYVTRNAKLVLIDHGNLKNSDDVQWYEVPFHSKTFARESSSLYEYISSFCDYFMSGLPNGAKHSRPSSLESH